jgi:hypothetical protein
MNATIHLNFIIKVNMLVTCKGVWIPCSNIFGIRFRLFYLYNLVCPKKLYEEQKCIFANIYLSYINYRIIDKYIDYIIGLNITLVVQLYCFCILIQAFLFIWVQFHKFKKHFFFVAIQTSNMVHPTKYSANRH